MFSLLATMYAIIIGAIFAFVFAILIMQYNQLAHYKNYPPGPLGLPFFGHLLFLGNNPAVTFMKWKKVYGPVFSIRFGSISTVVLNDPNLIKEALCLESFAGRPAVTNFQKITGLKGMIFPDGSRQLEQRKFVSKTFKEIGLSKTQLEFRAQKEVSTFINEFKERLSKELLFPLSSNNVKFPRIKMNQFFKFPVINSIWVAIVGKRFEEDDPTLQHLLALFQQITSTNRRILDQASWFFPTLSSVLCFFGINHTINASKALQSHIAKEIDQCKSNYIAGQPKHFSHAYFDKIANTHDINSSFHESRQEQPMTTFDILFGSLGTTTVTLDWLLLYMAREPQIQHKLQLEIDRILGSDELSKGRQISISDKVNMPYAEAVINEILRISSVAPLSLYRRTLTDVDFHSYRIPKDTMIISNIYATHHDPEIWEEPQRFLPERFLNYGKTVNNSRNDVLSFGRGRRNCIGEEFARDIVFLFATSFFQKFSVSCTSNIPSPEGEFGLVLEPQAFELIISERCSFCQ